MRRGDIVVIQAAGTPASKARPCVIVHRSDDPSTSKVTVCPLTSTRADAAHLRPFVTPSPENGLYADSEIEADWVFTVSIEKLKSRIGSLDARTMVAVDDALRRWLDL